MRTFTGKKVLNHIMIIELCFYLAYLIAVTVIVRYNIVNI